MPIPIDRARLEVRLQRFIERAAEGLTQPELTELAIAVDVGGHIGRLADKLFSHFVVESLHAGIRLESLQVRLNTRFAPMRFLVAEEYRQEPVSEVDLEAILGLTLADLIETTTRVDPTPGRARLDAAQALGDLLRDVPEQLVDALVLRARAAGATWGQIFYAVGWPETLRRYRLPRSPKI